MKEIKYAQRVIYQLRSVVDKMPNIEPCPKCKKANGYEWIWGKNDGQSKGYSKCKSCGAKF
jgi:hypothetical protein